MHYVLKGRITFSSCCKLQLLSQQINPTVRHLNEIALLRTSVTNQNAINDSFFF